mgnify:CR=1 FL=1
MSRHRLGRRPPGWERLRALSRHERHLRPQGPAQLLEQREALERQQLKMRSEASRQAAQLEAQREELTNQKRQMENEARLAFQRAQNASEEQARMRAEFQAQLAHQQQLIQHSGRCSWQLMHHDEAVFLLSS